MARPGQVRPRQARLGQRAAKKTDRAKNMADAISRESFVYSNAICKIGLLPARLPTTMV